MREKRIFNWITDNLTSLVRITGLLVSIGLLTILCSCREKEVYYVGQDAEQGAEDSVALAADESAASDAVISDAAASDAVASGVAVSNAVTVAEDGDSIVARDGTVTVAPTEEQLVVHLCGAVNNPGVYELKSDSRVIDAIIKAGGFSDEACEDALNLAMTVNDGSRIYVPTVEEAFADGTAVAGDSSKYIQENQGPVRGQGIADEADGKVNINTASKDKLMTLNGIGASRADAIILYREENGAFRSIEDIMNVTGIKSGSYEKIKDYITVN